jgi:type III restriction enzyme
MIELKKYQSDAVDGLIKDTYSLLKKSGNQHKMVFKAPTGSGKTVTMAAYLNRLCEELPEKFDLVKRQTTFIWIAPNQLHLQSFNALKNYFAELRSIRPIYFEDITGGRLNPNEILFLNWQSINKEGNLYIKENEFDKTLESYIHQTNDCEIILILDEAHLFASKGKAAQELLQKISAKIEIDVSATPYFQSEYMYTIKRPDVVEAEMIKQGVILNPNIEAHNEQEKSLNQALLEIALQKREELAKIYQKIGVKINPLLLIQLPNDSKTESDLDNEVKQEVIYLLERKGFTTQNNRLAVWLSDIKTNLDGIETPDNMVDVLLFKQAIALGWDCPRAAILLIFREIKQETFTIQTVGRILRMPEQKHYAISDLNYGYVYTNLSKNIIEIVQDDMDYIVQNKATRIESYEPINLPSYFINTRLKRNRLGSKFKKCFNEVAEEFFNITLDFSKIEKGVLYKENETKLEAKLIELNVNKIEIPIPKDVRIENEIGITQVTMMEKFAKTQSELNVIFRQFCNKHVGGYAKVDSTPTLEHAIKRFFELYLDINEFQALKIVLFESNKARFIEVIDRALNKHEILLHEKASSVSKEIEESNWEVPNIRIYNERYIERKSTSHVLEPFFEDKSASKPEKDFVKHLESNRLHIDWWYKNGDKNKEDFAVTYKDREGIDRGFYVDFVIKLKNGKLALFDTKTLDSDPEFCNKHNALHLYIKERQLKRKIVGGVIVQLEQDVWKYCDNPITSAKDTTGWISFDIALENKK